MFEGKAMTPAETNRIKVAANPVRVSSAAEAAPLAPGIKIKQVRAGRRLLRRRSR